MTRLGAQIRDLQGGVSASLSPSVSPVLTEGLTKEMVAGWVTRGPGGPGCPETRQLMDLNWIWQDYARLTT